MLHGVLWGSVLAAIHFSIYSMIQRMHIKFADGKNLEGNESIAKDKIILTKMEMRSVIKKKQNAPQQGQIEDILKANEPQKIQNRKQLIRNQFCRKGP